MNEKLEELKKEIAKAKGVDKRFRIISDVMGELWDFNFYCLEKQTEILSEFINGKK